MGMAFESEVSIQNDDPIQNARVRVFLLAGGVSLFLLGNSLYSITSIQWISIVVRLFGLFAALLGLASIVENRLVSALWRLSAKIARWLAISPFQLWVIYFGLALSLAGRAAAGNDREAHSPWHSIIWILGVVLVIIGCWRKDRSPEYVGLDSRDYLLIGLFFIASILVRSIFLDKVPFGLTGDEGEAGLYGLQFVEGLRNNLLDMGWNEFPALYFWLVSLAQRILGPTITAIRIVSVIGGSLSVIAVYWTSKQLFNQTHAVFSAAFLAGMHFHILFSRVAVNNIWDGLFLSLMIGGIWVAWRFNLRWAFILAGVAIGLSQYFYTTGRLIPIYAFLFLVLLRILKSRVGRLPGILSMTLVAFALVLPLGLYYVDNWHELIVPMRRVSLLHPSSLINFAESTGVNPIVVYSNQLKTTILGFVQEPIRGLYNPSTPMLLTFSSAIFAIGFVLCLVRFRDPRYIILALSLVGPVLAGALSIEAPNSQRLLFTTPVVALIIGIPFTEFANILKIAWPRARALVILIPLTVLAVIIALNLTFFFFEAIPDQRFSDRRALLAREISEFLNDKPPGTDVYVIGPAEIGFYSIPSVPYLSSHINGYDLFWPLEGDQELPLSIEDPIFIFQPSTVDAYQQILDQYPNAEIEIVYDQKNTILFRALIVSR